jgi:hypothetical protein
MTCWDFGRVAVVFRDAGHGWDQVYSVIEYAESLVTIKKRKVKVARFKGLQASTVSASVAGVTSTTLRQEDLITSDETDTPQSLSERLLQNLTVSDGGTGPDKVLLCIAFVSDEQRQAASQFPEA